MADTRLILKASAGTGKTYRMSWEYVAALCKDLDDIQKYKKILVMTFTKKATAEIKDRILAHLREIVKGTPEGENITKLIEANYGPIVDKAKLKIVYEEILKNKEEIKIYTIDSFCGLLFKKILQSVKNIFAFEMIDDYENDKIMLNVLNHMLKEHYSQAREFFVTSGERNMDNYADVMKNLISRRWQVSLVGDSIINKMLPEKHFVDEMDAVVRLTIAAAHDKGKDPFEDGFFKTKYRDFDKYPLEGDEDSKKKFLLEYDTVLLTPKEDKWEGIWNGNKIKGKNNKYKEDIELSYDMFAKNFAIYVFNERVLQYEKNIFAFLKSLYDYYDKMKFSSRKFTFDDVSNYTLEFLSNPKYGFCTENTMTDDFYEAIGGKIDTIFIDEFQDTSVLQWKILHKIINDCDNVLCVGDDKQSIYSWRGGEKYLFQNLENIIDKCTPDTLATCFRSDKNIVDFTNDVFQQVMSTYPNWKFENVNPKSDKVQGGVVVIDAANTEDLNDSDDTDKLKDMYENLAGKEVDSEKGAYRIAKYIADTIAHGKSLGEIGIISRQNRDLSSVAKHLDRLGIKYDYATRAEVTSNSFVRLLYLVIKYICKNDISSLIAFLQSQYINVPNNIINDILWTDNLEEYMNTSGNSVLSTICELKNYYLEKNGKTKDVLYHIVYSLRDIIISRDAVDVLNMYKLYSLMETHEYLDDFVSDYEDKKDTDKYRKLSLGGGNAISLVTIHGSKGLGYDTVFYYHASHKSMPDSGLQTFVKMDSTFENIEKYIFTDAKYAKILSLINDYKDLVDLQANVKKEEELNTLYVALTRAKNNMILVFENGTGKDSETYAFCTNAMRDEYKDIVYLPAEDKVEKASDIDTSIYDFSNDENMTFAPSSELPSELVSQNKQLRGTAIHYFLEQFTSYPDDNEIMLAKSRVYSKYGFELEDKEISKILDICKANRIFDRKGKAWDNIYNEYVIFYKDNEYRMDRVMIKHPNKEGEKGEIYIADYKTGSHKDAQLKTYEKAIKESLGDEAHKYTITSAFVEI